MGHKFGAFISFIGGAAALAGYFVKSLGDYYLIVAGGVLAIIGAIISFKSYM